MSSIPMHIPTSRPRLWVLLAGIAVFALWIALVVCVTSALSGVFQTALYHYAANGMPPAAFAPATLERAFVPKRSRR